MNNIDKNARSFVKNLCPWTISFTLPISNGSVLLGANKKTSVNNEELIALCENANVMFFGIENGNHARVYIENDDLRKFVGYDSEDGKEKQFVLTDEECQKILDYKTISTFEKHLKEKIICNHEKAKLVEYARKIKLNDYDKIVLIENHTNIKFRED